ncbi:uncharacterized protein BO72DRAFT_76063 [Aspergillus fijiensis CBS 313.89]|uniref:Uncharacterized protein n=1 Tax=Aspergillus fijiensis CBS 313.89 TaxID=1448319 RepID=A0A8G1RUF8_9EURO|nr:uncharacterized protein BO72DRAFT_76063 [Aspergillus fijiensis CBS 313.89]RAK78518.1 hypothetical protein BO72DRAFT_76063 [Aspergillus fijiensis CBS 313.89]
MFDGRDVARIYVWEFRTFTFVLNFWLYLMCGERAGVKSASRSRLEKPRMWLAAPADGADLRGRLTVPQ